MNKKELMESIDQAYKATQMLDLKPTKNNATILLNIMTVFEKCYEYIQEHGDDARPEEDGGEK